VRAAAVGYALLGAASLFYLLGLFGPSYRLELWSAMAWGWWATLTLAVVAVLVGRACSRRWWVGRGLDRTSKLLLYGVVGSFALYATLLLLAVLRRLDYVGLVLLLPALVPVVFVQVRSLWRERHRWSEASADPAVSEGPPRWLAVTLGVLLGVWSLPYLLQTLLPNTDWDAAMYHLPLAWRFIEGRIGELDPAFEHVSFPGAAHLFYAVLDLLGAPRGVTPLNFVFAAATLAGAWALARRFWGWRAGLWAAALVVATPIVWELGLDARVDGALAFYVLVGTWAFLMWWEDRSFRGALLLVGIAFGMAAGVKYPALVYLAVPWLGVAVGVGIDRVRGLRPDVVGLAAAVLLLVVPSSYWYARNAVVLGDPMYPVLHGLEYRDEGGGLKPFEPEFRKLFAGLPPDDTLAGDPLLARFFAAARTPMVPSPPHMFDVVDIIRRPERYERSKPGETVSVFLLAFLLLPFVIRRRNAWWLFVLVMAPFLVMGWRYYLIRYAMPTWPLMAVGAGAVLGRVRRAPVVAALAGALLLLDVVGVPLPRSPRESAFPPNRGVVAQLAKMERNRPLAYLGGAESRIQWLRRTGYHNLNTIVPWLSYIDQNVREGRISPTDTVLMVSEAKGELLLVDYLPDPLDWGYRWLSELARQDGDLDAMARSFRRRGIRFVLVNYPNLLGQVGYLTAHHDHMKMVLWSLDTFLGRYGRTVYDVDGVRMVHLDAER